MIEGKCTAQGRLVGMDCPTSTISDAQVAEIRRMRAEGHIYATIAKTVGCCVAYAQKVIVGKLRSAEPVRTIKRATDADFARVQALHAQGNGYENIAKMLGTTRSSTRILLLKVKAHAAHRS